MKSTAAAMTAATFGLANRAQGARLAAAHGPAPIDAAVFDAVIFDERYGDARAFAAELGRLRGIPQFQTRQDVGRLCYGALREILERPRVMIAGLTPYSDVYVLQTFAVERKLRLLYEGMHDCRRRTSLTHDLRVPANLRGLAAHLERAGAAWSASVARAVLDCVPGSRPGHRERVETSTPWAPDHPGTLVSWVLG